jgi:hypothetical protein
MPMYKQEKVYWRTPFRCRVIQMPLESKQNSTNLHTVAPEI